MMVLGVVEVGCVGLVGRFLLMGNGRGWMCVLCYLKNCLWESR